MFRKILVPLDGSELAERALEPALKIARRDGSQLLLMRVAILETILVADPVTFGGYDVVWPEQALARSREQAREYLESIQQTKLDGAVASLVQVMDGDVAAGIVDTAASEKVDLIVMSTHGYSGLTRWMLGSVAEKVLRIAPCPVLVLRSEKPLRHALISLDGSELAEAALEPGFDLAAALEARVTLLRAVPDVTAEEVGHMENIETGLGRRLLESLTDEAETYLSDRARVRREAGIEIQTVVKQGHAAECILSFAETHAVDLVCMATHGRTGLKRWAYGSVTEKVLRSTHASMLVARCGG